MREREREKHILSPFVLDAHRQISRKANNREDLVKALALKRKKEKKKSIKKRDLPRLVHKCQEAVS